MVSKISIPLSEICLRIVIEMRSKPVAEEEWVDMAILNSILTLFYVEQGRI
jgi:hypothetical protein